MSAATLTATPEDLRHFVSEVWCSHVAQVDELVPAAPHTWTAQPCWSGAVSVTGEWRGMIAVDLADPSAEALARGMLALQEGEELEVVELSDVVGEFANIVGGNVKSLMPGPSTLSLPLVAHTVLEPPSELHPQVTLDLAWRDAPVRVRVLAAPSPIQHHTLSEVTP
jgi:chemotaxis protein CheX